MGVICIDKNTTTVDKLQAAIKYIFDLAVCNVRGQIASIFSRRGKCLSYNISKAEIANISYYDGIPHVYMTTTFAVFL